MLARFFAATAALALLAACGPSGSSETAPAAAESGMDEAAQGDPRRADPELAPADDHSHDGDAAHEHGPDADHAH